MRPLNWPWSKKRTFSETFIKAMTAGTGTDAAEFAGGRATIKESLTGRGGRKKRKKRRCSNQLVDLLDDFNANGGTA